MSVRNDLGLIDCHFYFDRSGCAKPACEYRHCPNAKGSFEVCPDWLAGICTWVNCPKRHAHVGSATSFEDSEKADDDTSDSESPLIYVERECEICLGSFPHHEMFCFITCKHSMCKECIVGHFETQIKSNSITNIVCPHQNCINLNQNDVDVHEYFSLLIPQLKGILRTELIELLEKKLCEWSLATDPTFTWCPQCGNGFIIECANADNFINCSSCSTPICPLCKKIWSQQHLGITCEQYDAQLHNKITIQNSEKALEKFLASFGVACPNCQTKFAKSSGGCLHFTCIICNYKFCEGCLQPFYNNGECPQSSCAGFGFHGHHPRNCYFYLRDWDPERLQKLLSSVSIPYNTKPLHDGAKCPLVEQKEKEDERFVDEECGEAVEPNYSGLCRKHYTQYLGWLVLKNKIDPICLYSVEELEQILVKASLPLPTNDINYSANLLETVKKLTKNGVLSNATTISECYAPFLNKEKCKRQFWFDETDDEDEDKDYKDEVKLYWNCGKQQFSYKTEEIEGDELLFHQIGAIAIAPGRPVDVPPPNSWTCTSCTYVNPNASKICDICSRTRGIGFDDYEVNRDGVECPQCTYLNDEDVVICDVCLYNLNQ